MDRLLDSLEQLLNASSPHFKFFDAALTGKVNRFKRLALEHAESEGIGVAEAIGKIRDEREKGSLHIAAEGGRINVCKYLIETLKLDVDCKDIDGITPLYHAIFQGHLDTVVYLLEKGANADASTDWNYTPLHRAAETGDTKIITLLLSRGARIDVPTRKGTALLYAVGEGHLNAVKVLLDHGANPNVVSSPRYVTPLLKALALKSWECAELLLQAGANPNAASLGYTPLACAADRGQVDGIRRLLEAGADPNFIINSGMTALEIAALNRNYQMAGVLFPVTSPIPAYPDWSISGLMRDVDTDPINMQRNVGVNEKFQQAKLKGRDAFQEKQYLLAANWYEEAWTLSPKDPALLSNMSACLARLGDRFGALEYATKCVSESPEWPKAYYRLGVALNMEKKYGAAADAFNKGLKLDPKNKELKAAYMRAMEDRFNSIKV